MSFSIGILGGTFDPPHNGHLHVAKTVLNFLQLDQLRFIPCKQPVHKADAHATSQQRQAMLNLALEDEPKFYLDTQELQRENDSYSIYTLQELRRQYPGSPLIFIIGLDSFLSFHTWFKWQSFTDYAHLFVVSRPNFDYIWPKEMAELKAKQTTNKQELIETVSGKIYLHEMDSLDVSSTNIRKGFKFGKEVGNLLPEKVFTYIKQNKVY